MADLDPAAVHRRLLGDRRARFVDAQYWEAESKQAAIDRLKAGIDNLRDVPGENPPATRDTVAIDAQEDFTNSITENQGESPALIVIQQSFE